MIALLQRVSFARVTVHNKTIAAIEQGLLALIGVERDDTEKVIPRMAERLLGYRIFSDEQGRMNLNLQTIKGGLLLVPQFTLAADTQSGMRPSFTSAAPPKLGDHLFHQLFNYTKTQYAPVEIGEFGANMQINLCNDGPVTFLLRVRT